MRQHKDELGVADNNNMNICEGHLGGYIISAATPAPSGLNVTHGDPATWYPELWLWVMSSLNIRSVLDVGCGEGHCMGFFRQFGCAVRGVDGSRLAKERSVLDECHDVHDYLDGPYVPDGLYDLVWCCEFVEHVEERYVDNYLQTFKAAKNFIFLTHAVPGQPGWHHVNCQPADYWVDKLQQIGFEYHASLTEHARRVAHEGHFKDKGLIFSRSVGGSS